MAPEAPPKERRAHARYSPDPWLPVVFSTRRSDMQCAGHIVDISEGGLRLVAPPSCPVPMVWGDAIHLTVAYSESARQHGFEGLDLEAVVVRVVSDSRAFTVNAMFRERDLQERLRDYVALLESLALSRASGARHGEGDADDDGDDLELDDLEQVAETG